MEKKVIYCKDDKEALEQIREWLTSGYSVHVRNEYETFYGVGFDSWLRKGISDIPCDIEVTGYNTWEGYPWDYEITPNN